MIVYLRKIFQRQRNFKERAGCSCLKIWTGSLQTQNLHQCIARVEETLGSRTSITDIMVYIKYQVELPFAIQDRGIEVCTKIKLLVFSSAYY